MAYNLNPFIASTIDLNKCACREWYYGINDLIILKIILQKRIRIIKFVFGKTSRVSIL